MIVKEIKINGFRSIKNEITIKLDDSKFYAFIGKNGSGKTNILRAIKNIFSNNIYENKKQVESADFSLELTNDEIENYFNFIKGIDNTTKLIKVHFDGDDPRIKTVEAPTVEISVKEIKEKIYGIFDKIKDSCRSYLNSLKKLFEDNCKDREIASLSIHYNTSNSNSVYKSIEKDINKNIKDIEKELEDNFKDDIIKIEENGYAGHIRTIINNNLRPIKLDEDRELAIDSNYMKTLNITKEQLEDANLTHKNYIRDINQKLEDSYQSVEACVEEYKKTLEKFNNIFNSAEDRFYNKKEEIEKKEESFLTLLNKACFRTVCFLDNENSLLFSNDNYRNRNNNYGVTTNPIMETFHGFLLDNNIYKESENILDLKTIDQGRLHQLVNYINKNFLNDLIPDFDRDEIKGFKLKIEEGNALKLYVIEKSGDSILFNNTSLGRRWYLTFLFLSKVLKAGDILLLDEPAAFLHPSAQVEIKEKLIDLSNKGIYVFIATHSSCMIPDDWKYVYNVEMTNKGSIIRNFSTSDDLCKTIMDGIGTRYVNEILFNLSKTLLLVEGEADKACVEKIGKIAGYNLNDYKIMPCNGSPILDVTYLCIEYKIKFKALFDYDTKDKPVGWLNKKYGYKEYIKIFETNKNCVFTPEEGKRKSLEDCFSEEDQEKYFSEYKIGKDDSTIKKIDKNKVNKGKEFTEDTIKNFEQLFRTLEIPKLDNDK